MCLSGVTCLLTECSCSKLKHNKKPCKHVGLAIDEHHHHLINIYVTCSLHYMGEQFLKYH